MTLSSTRTEDGGVTSFSFTPARPFTFRAGQHGLLFVPKGGFKPFSIASSPQDGMVTIGTRLSSESKFKLALAALQPGATARFFGPLGSFTIAGTAPELVLLAQGVGITPIRSILIDLRQRGVDKPTTLVHVGVDHPFRADTEPLADRAIYPSNSESFRVQVAAEAEGHKAATFMISGAPAFIESTKALLREHGVPAERIRLDSMRGY
jgi:ferredoxin-NADP reductase